jgi:hypothetical protein
MKEQNNPIDVNALTEKKDERTKIFEKPKLFDVYASYVLGAILLVISFLIFFVAFSSMANEAVFQNITFLRVCHGVLIFIGVVTSCCVVLGFIFARYALMFV